MQPIGDRDHKFIKTIIDKGYIIRETYKCIKCEIGRIDHYINLYNGIEITCDEQIIKNIIE